MTYKVMIVDDEVIARIGLANTIDWEANGYTIVGYASDATSALRIAAQTHPDIAIVDIIMPEMNGIELIGRLREQEPLMEYVIVSCMDDISYYRDAIKLDISSYINKGTFRETELLTALEKARRRVAEKRLLNEFYDESKSIGWMETIAAFLAGAIFRGGVEREEVRRKLTSAGVAVFEPYRLVVIDLSGYPGQYTDTFEQAAVSICADITEALFPAFTFRNTHREVLSLIPGETGHEALDNLRYRVRQTSLQYYDWEPELGWSQSTESLGDLQTAYRQAKRRLTERFFTDHPAEAVLSNSHPLRSEELQKVSFKLMDVKITQPLGEVKEVIDCLTETILDAEFYDIQTCRDLYTAFLFSLISQAKKAGLSELPETKLLPREIVEGCPKFRDLNDRVLEIFSNIHDAAQTGSGKTEQVRRYIEEHITEKLRVADIASALYLNPAYLGRIFVADTGEHLHRYITRRKLEYACGLLRDGRDVTDVSETLSFSTTSHFISLFRDQYGVTPKRFLRHQAGKEGEGGRAPDQTSLKKEDI